MAPEPAARYGRRNVRRTALAFAAILLLTVLTLSAYAFRTRWLPIPARFLVVRDPLEASDVILLLNGDPNLRPPHAAALYRNHLAPLLLIARSADSTLSKLGLWPNTTDLNVGVLMKLGVPQSNIVELKMPGGVTSTFDEAKLLRTYTATHPVQRVIVVTSAFHTRRAKWAMERVLRGTSVQIRMAPVDDVKYSEANWWTREDGQVACNDEYVKLVWYVLHYGFRQ